MPRMAMLIDMTRCIGCDACTVACKQENGTPMDVFFARVLNIESGRYPNVKRMYVPVLCNHCDDAPCLKSCPNKAIVRRQDGIVLIDQDRCKGTGACVSACPYGNVYLSKEDSWYLNEDERYEKDFVRPRLNQNVARKCTYCAHRVDEGLDPACVVACPTEARIFGDIEDANSKVSKYIVQQRAETNRSPFHLLPEAGTKPAGMYLGPMSLQESHTHGNRASTDGVEPISHATRLSEERQQANRQGVRSFLKRKLTLLRVASSLLAIVPTLALSQEPALQMEKPATDHFSTSTCTGCHGVTAMGGLGPPIASTKLTNDEFLSIVRKGKGMMPGTTAPVISDETVIAIRNEVAGRPWIEDEIPISYKVGRLLSTKSVGIVFLIVFLVATVFGFRSLTYWLSLAGLQKLKPAIRRFGRMRALGVVAKALTVEGFFVASLYRKSKHRWAMHGLMIYGFFGLMAADIWMQIVNPARADMSMGSGPKMLAVLSGAAVFLGICYVLYRYKTDEYIDNGVTLGKDFLFVNLLFHTIVSGFLTVAINHSGASDWLMTIYIYHLLSISLLILTAPFTRFMHVWVAPSMIAMTRLAEAITASGAEIAFEREPSPGRHHKSERIADQIVTMFDPDAANDVRIRYYP